MPDDLNWYAVWLRVLATISNTLGAALYWHNPAAGLIAFGLTVGAFALPKRTSP